MTITIDTMKALREEINAAIAAVGDKHGVTVSLGNGSYDRDGLTAHFKLNVVAKGDDGEVVDEALTQLRRFQPSFEGVEVKLRGEAYTVVGYNPKARKNKFVIARSSDCKRFVIDAWSIASLRTDKAA